MRQLTPVLAKVFLRRNRAINHRAAHKYMEPPTQDSSFPCNYVFLLREQIVFAREVEQDLCVRPAQSFPLRHPCDSCEISLK